MVLNNHVKDRKTFLTKNIDSNFSNFNLYSNFKFSK